MGKSKVRGGAKAHRQRVQNRNQGIKNQQSAIQKLFNESIKAQIEELKDKFSKESGSTENQ
jgi:hypothetical protein